MTDDDPQMMLAAKAALQAVIKARVSDARANAERKWKGWAYRTIDASHDRLRELAVAVQGRLRSECIVLAEDDPQRALAEARLDGANRVLSAVFGDVRYTILATSTAIHEFED